MFYLKKNIIPIRFEIYLYIIVDEKLLWLVNYSVHQHKEK